MSEITPDETLDVIGLMCPMPLVKARQHVMKLEVGSVLKVLATDRGSVRDFQGWARTAKNIELLKQSEVSNNGKTVFEHYVERIK